MLLTDCVQAVHTKMTCAVMNDPKSINSCAVSDGLDEMRFRGLPARGCLWRLPASCTSVAGKMRTIHSA